MGDTQEAPSSSPFRSVPAGQANAQANATTPISSPSGQQQTSTRASGGSGGSASGWLANLRRSAENQQAVWTIAPLNNVAVRFSLEGLGDPLHRILGTELRLDLADSQKIAEALRHDAHLREQLAQALDVTWTKYNLTGAILLYEDADPVRKAFTQALQPERPPARAKKKDDDSEQESSDEEDREASEEQVVTSFVSHECLRAIDPAVVLNVLARARGQVLVENTALALETAFLERSYITDDPRVIALVRATGYVSEAW